MDLRYVNPDLVLNQVIAELIIEKQRRDVENRQNQKDRYNAYKNVRQDQPAANFPQQLPPDESKKFPAIVDRRNDQQKTGEIHHQQLGWWQEPPERRDQSQEPHNDQDECKNPHPRSDWKLAQAPVHGALCVSLGLAVLVAVPVLTTQTRRR